MDTLRVERGALSKAAQGRQANRQRPVGGDRGACGFPPARSMRCIVHRVR